mmetsp:Transcript_18944/g.44145  ORF Transcript_18944/g.44145 Transcript_18944/m.44145 type:complete len:111 (-) Transcript_18944:501-833(-)
MWKNRRLRWWSNQSLRISPKDEIQKFCSLLTPFSGHHRARHRECHHDHHDHLHPPSPTMLMVDKYEADENSAKDEKQERQTTLSLCEALIVNFRHEIRCSKMQIHTTTEA